MQASKQARARAVAVRGQLPGTNSRFDKRCLPPLPRQGCYFRTTLRCPDPSHSVNLCDGKPRSRNPWPSRPPHPLIPTNSHIEKVELLPNSLPHGGVDPFFSYSTLPVYLSCTLSC
ncbi:hypothetical protein B0T13DRAFT_105412 [Neurospora crassa]|nr:hypothetical protein B0T13DRAFT_105412 [Neurospora crassa]